MVQEWLREKYSIDSKRTESESWFGWGGRLVLVLVGFGMIEFGMAGAGKQRKEII